MKHFADSDTERNEQEETGHRYIRTMIGIVYLMSLACGWTLLRALHMRS